MIVIYDRNESEFQHPLYVPNSKKEFTIQELSKINGINEKTIRTRLQNGWTWKDATTIPARKLVKRGDAQ